MRVTDQGERNMITFQLEVARPWHAEGSDGGGKLVTGIETLAEGEAALRGALKATLDTSAVNDDGYREAIAAIDGEPEWILTETYVVGGWEHMLRVVDSDADRRTVSEGRAFAEALAMSGGDEFFASCAAASFAEAETEAMGL